MDSPPIAMQAANSLERTVALGMLSIDFINQRLKPKG
ncbi:hypothetical protein ACP4OV_012832 [Aristida adscensionis]